MGGRAREGKMIEWLEKLSTKFMNSQTHCRSHRHTICKASPINILRFSRKSSLKANIFHRALIKYMFRKYEKRFEGNCIFFNLFTFLCKSETLRMSMACFNKYILPKIFSVMIRKVYSSSS